jgi:hypothetical protein
MKQAFALVIYPTPKFIVAVLRLPCRLRRPMFRKIQPDPLLRQLRAGSFYDPKGLLAYCWNPGKQKLHQWMKQTILNS